MATKLCESVAYDPDSPSGLVWAVTRSNRAKAGNQAGYKMHNGYYQVRIDGIDYAAHRVVYKLHNPDWDIADTTMFVDHISRDKSNNCIENLRLVTPAESMRNISRNRSPETSSDVPGVVYVESTGLWNVRVWVDGKFIHIKSVREKEIAEVIGEIANILKSEGVRSPEEFKKIGDIV